MSAKLLSIAEASVLIGCTPAQLRELERLGDIEFERVGANRIIRIEQLASVRNAMARRGWRFRAGGDTLGNSSSMVPLLSVVNGVPRLSLQVGNITAPESVAREVAKGLPARMRGLLTAASESGSIDAERLQQLAETMREAVVQRLIEALTPDVLTDLAAADEALRMARHAIKPQPRRRSEQPKVGNAGRHRSRSEASAIGDELR